MAKVDALIAQARAQLEPGEQPLAAVAGLVGVTKGRKRQRGRAGVLTATDRRLVLYAKRFGGFDLVSYGYDQVSGIQESMVFGGGWLTVLVPDGELRVKVVPADAAYEAFCRLVRERVGMTA